MNPMNFKDFFDIELPIDPKDLLLEVWMKPINLTDGKKSKVNLSLDDVKSVPTKFKMYFTFTIQFNSAAIRQKFEQEKPADIQTQIQKSMTTKTSGMVSTEPKFVDYKTFYLEVVKPELSAIKIQQKLNKFAQAGTFSLQDFSISKVEYPLIAGVKVDDIILWKQFVGKDKKNAKASPIKLQFGYSVEFAATNQLKIYSRTEVMELAKSFVPEFEQAMLKDTDYFEFTMPILPTMEQNVYGVPLKLWRAGDSDAALYNEQDIFNEQNIFDVPLATDADNAETTPSPGTGEPRGGAVLKGDTGKKIASRIMSGINFAIGRLSMRELRPGRTLTGIPELLRVVKHAYQIPPVEEMPEEFIRPNVEKWLNMHDPITDKIPILQNEDGTLKILTDEEIKKMQKERQQQQDIQGAQVPAGGAGY